MKFSRVMLWIPFLALCTSCGTSGLPYEKRIPLATNASYVKDDSLSYSELSYANYSEHLIFEEVLGKINRHESFVLYLYSETCHGCMKVKPQLMHYICETQYVFTTAEIYAEGNDLDTYKDTLYQTFPDFFPNGFLTPAFYFFLEGEPIASQIGLTEKTTSNYRYFKSFIEGYIRPIEK